MHPGTTRIPQIIDKLISLAAEATGLQVTDGAHIGELDDEALCIGLTLAESAGYNVEVAKVPEYGRARYRENFSIRCMLSLLTGETDMKPLRQRAGEHLGALTNALTAAPRQDGVWDEIGFGNNAEWIPLQTDQGAAMSVIFTIDGACLL